MLFFSVPKSHCKGEAKSQDLFIFAYPCLYLGKSFFTANPYRCWYWQVGLFAVIKHFWSFSWAHEFTFNWLENRFPSWFLKVTIDNKSKPQTAETRHPFKRTDGKAIAKLIAAYDSPELRPIFTPQSFFWGENVAFFLEGIICFCNFHIICSQIGYHYVPFLNAVNRLHV